MVNISNNTGVLSLLEINFNKGSHRSAHQLKINTDKTKKLLVDPRSAGHHSHMAVYRHNIKQVKSSKYLEKHIDEDLSQHTQLACVWVWLHQSLHFSALIESVWSLQEYYIDSFLQFCLLVCSGKEGAKL